MACRRRVAKQDLTIGAVDHSGGEYIASGAAQYDRVPDFLSAALIVLASHCDLQRRGRQPDLETISTVRRLAIPFGDQRAANERDGLARGRIAAGRRGRKGEAGIRKRAAGRGCRTFASDRRHAGAKHRQQCSGDHLPHSKALLPLFCPAIAETAAEAQLGGDATRRFHWGRG